MSTPAEAIESRRRAARQDARDELFAVMAHRLLGSVAAVRGGVELLADPDLSPARADSVREVVRRQAEQLETILTDVVRSGQAVAPAGLAVSGR